MVGSSETPIILIGGTDYGPLGLNKVSALDVSPTGPGLIGTATIELKSRAGAYLTFTDKTEVKIYTVTVTQAARRHFAGFISAQAITRQDDTSPIKLTTLTCQDYSLLLKRLVLRKENDYQDYADAETYPHFLDQIGWAVANAQTPPGGDVVGGYPSLPIDVNSSVDPGPVLDNSERFAGKSLGYMLKSICTAAMTAEPALKLRWFIGVDAGVNIALGSFTFGGPVLQIYDAIPTSPSTYYTDNKAHFNTLVPSGGGRRFQTIHRLSRQLDGSSVVQWRQGTYAGDVLFSQPDPTPARASADNIYSADGLWKDEWLGSITAADSDAAQGLLDQNVTATVYARDTNDVVSLTPTLPGQVASLESAMFGFTAADSWYAVTSLATSWRPGEPVFHTMRLGDRALLLGQNASDG